ncbi:MAG: Rrf2 family transcriptional regulator [Deltaproteobacteria bacterium]|nr:Rrf2 family transcriptional regulator [Deltaproteobacteria bacterium]MBW2339430.1 Rrf2 family transcriptional regulator [Deltaproteobacteria bacterium]
MKISTKGRYSTRAMLDLALHFGKGPVLIRDISKRQKISKGYLEQLFIPLRSAGLVRGIRGVSGGFTLVRPPTEIKLSEIIRATEGSCAPAVCVDDSNLCGQSSECIARDVWAEIKRACDRVLESKTLQDLVEKQRAKSAESSKE